MMTEEEFETAMAERRRQIDEARLNKPVRSDIREGTPSSRYWCALLDGRPVAHCRAFDTEEGWVEVYAVVKNPDSPAIRTKHMVRLFGAVEPVWVEEWERLKKQIPPIEVLAVEEKSE